MQQEKCVKVNFMEFSAAKALHANLQKEQSDVLEVSLSNCSKLTDPSLPTEERIEFLALVNSEADADAVPMSRTFCPWLTRAEVATGAIVS